MAKPIVKKLKDVQVGSLLSVGGVKYKVKSNTGIDLYLVAEIFPGAYEVTQSKFSNLRVGITNQDTILWLLSEPEIKTKSLTDSLRQQVKQQELTASLKVQMEDEEEEAEEDFDDWLDGFVDEDETDYQPNPHFHTGFSLLDGTATKEQALKADLKAQLAQQGALNASLKATKVDNKVEDLVHDLYDTFEGIEEKIDVLEDDVRDIDSDLSYLETRVQKLETAKLKEEKQMNLQQQLNARLAAQKNQASLQAQLDAKLNQNKTTGGNGTMKNVLGAFKAQFGKVEGKFAFSVATNGLALRKGISNEFVAYDKAEKTLTDVTGLTLKFDVPAFKLPVSEKDVKVGDLVIHNGEYVYVTKVADGYLETLNPEKAVRGSVVPTKNAILGAAFYTVVKTLDGAEGTGFNPMLLMAMGDGKKDDLLPLLLMSGGLGGAAQAGQIDPTMLMLLGDSVDELLPLVLMQQSGVAGQGFNPLMFLAMNKGGKSKDLLPLLAMSGGLGGNTQGQAGAMNPMMMMALAGDGDLDPMTLMMMSGGFGGQGLGGLFGGQAPATEVKAKDKK